MEAFSNVCVSFLKFENLCHRIYFSWKKIRKTTSPESFITALLNDLINSQVFVSLSLWYLDENQLAISAGKMPSPAGQAPSPDPAAPGQPGPSVRCGSPWFAV